jgi:uncharacterized protein YjbJ (UPF0337 family)
MSDTKKKFENLKDRVEGEIKESVGKVTGNQELEFEGKMKKKVVDFKEKSAEIKKDVFKKLNDKLDKSDKSDK